ncbi:hypothetical protein TRVA0_014S01420 [Trichomonascus vanleenenianus]|uniref:U4/U6-U5 snRNP complex subunit PRP3 n=1 Tax=Trichomonascus vanleenenianus TaxID=2268995 RepID=UPI003EC9D8BE
MKRTLAEDQGSDLKRPKISGESKSIESIKERIASLRKKQQGKATPSNNGSVADSDAKKPGNSNAELLERLRAKRAALAGSKPTHKLETDGDNSSINSSAAAATSASSDARARNLQRLQEIRARKSDLTKPRVDSKEPSMSRSEGSSERSKSATPIGQGLNVPVHPIFLEQSTQGGARDQKSAPMHNKYLEETPTEDETKNPYFDASLSAVPSRPRRRRGLVFNPHGKYIEKAEEIRHQHQLEEMNKRIVEENAAKQESQKSSIDFAAGEREYAPPEPPEVEWWDAEILNNSIPITHYIQHPVPIKPPWERHQPAEIKMHMTKKEMKRQRKITRAARYKEQQDRIRLGLDPAPPPKVKLSNMMRVYMNEAIHDPTATEHKVKHEMAERKSKHEQENADRKLSEDQKWEKKLDKIEQDKAKGVYSAVFRVEKLVDGKHKFIVNDHAKRSGMTGIVIFNEKFVLIIVEGSKREVDKYVKLMTNRVKWTEAAPPRDEEEAANRPDLSDNKCSIVWYGQLKRPKFMKWTLNDAETEQDAKDILSRNEAEHYWMQARQISVLDST